MTPEERAWELGKRLGLVAHRGAIADEIRAAEEAVRERCARVADGSATDHLAKYPMIAAAAKDIAEDIRRYTYS